MRLQDRLPESSQWRQSRPGLISDRATGSKRVGSQEDMQSNVDRSIARQRESQGFECRLPILENEVTVAQAVEQQVHQL